MEYNNNNNNNVTESRRTHSDVVAHKSDIIIKNKNWKTCILIYVAVPTEGNVALKKAETKLKYNNLCPELQRMFIPVERRIWKPYEENIEQIHYLEHRT
jgi:hypothetical protein